MSDVYIERYNVGKQKLGKNLGNVGNVVCCGDESHITNEQFNSHVRNLTSLGLLHMKEKKFFYVLKCCTPLCRTRYKFACKCKAAELLLCGCDNCGEMNFEVLERWNKTRGMLVGKTVLGPSSISRIINDSQIQSSRQNDSENPFRRNGRCNCKCNCSCECVWLEPRY